MIINNSRIERMVAVKSYCVAVLCSCAEARFSYPVKVSMRRSKS
jgi:hypothetical protein